MKITVIIPTYNERENITILIPTLFEKFNQFPDYFFNLLIVDGNSNDGTSEVVKEYKNNFSNLHLIEEKSKSGLGGAYIKGFKYSMDTLKSDYVVEMDADLQHNPDDFKKLIEQIKNGYDLIIGSRYVRGGSVPQEWSFRRKFISKYGSLFTKLLLGLNKIQDCSSGFKVTKVRGFLDSINFDEIKSKGFAYKFDMLIQFYEMGAKIKEVPIAFGLRDRGTSKMERSNFAESFKVVLHFAKLKYKNFIKFVVVGFGGLFTDLLIFNISNIFVRSSTASIISGSIAMLFTFSFNNFWSFRDREKIILRMIIPTFFFYAASSYVPILLRSYLIHELELRFGESLLISNLGMLIGISFGIIWNFTVYSKIIWKRKNK